jgi:hypothetical protein
MSSYLELDKETLIQFANGIKIDTFTISSTSSPSGVIDVGPALTWCDSQGWVLYTFSQSAGKSIYILKHA